MDKDIITQVDTIIEMGPRMVSIGGTAAVLGAHIKTMQALVKDGHIEEAIYFLQNCDVEEIFNAAKKPDLSELLPLLLKEED